MAAKPVTSRIVAALVAGVGLGLLLAGLGIMGWWSLSVRERPLQVVSDAAPLEALLDSAPYISLNRGERPVYVVAPRSSPELDRWLLNDAVALAEQGREVRVIMVPSGHGGAAEDATIAELWLSRDIDLLAEWMSMRAEHWTAIGIEPVAGSPERLAAHAEAAALARTLMQRVGQGADDARWPLIIWRDGANQLAACLCQRSAAAKEARYALRLNDSPDGASEVLDHPTTEPIPHRAEPDDGYEDQYPRLNYAEEPPAQWQGEADLGEGSGYRTPSPQLPGDVVEGDNPETPRPRAERPAPAPRAQPAQPRAPRVLNTAPPKAEKDAESLFY